MEADARILMVDLDFGQAFPDLDRSIISSIFGWNAANIVRKQAELIEKRIKES